MKFKQMGEFLFDCLKASSSLATACVLLCCFVFRIADSVLGINLPKEERILFEGGIESWL
ncbi:hypothetical protein CDL12_13952 [Handroanthus impetiginosus]|uniref:Uncharacterized protein n=1 Tax=Handroanthus impetiginosus TaxID=429701 RepID=A0A2G9H7D3_9LAMI|nr:hypothetical protein CDL12_13952 [Handroanthus impetiginosus]